MPDENAEQVKVAEETPRGSICYLFGVLFPLLYLLTVSRKKQNSFLRFHCIQCLLLFLLWTPFLFLQHGLPGYISSVGFLLCSVGWVVAMVQARRRKQFHLPVIGLVAERLT